MALPAEKPTAKVKPSATIADWYEVYYTPEPANLPSAPELSALDQMFAYYDG